MKDQPPELDITKSKHIIDQYNFDRNSDFKLGTSCLKLSNEIKWATLSSVQAREEWYKAKIALLEIELTHTKKMLESDKLFRKGMELIK